MTLYHDFKEYKKKNRNESITELTEGINKLARLYSNIFEDSVLTGEFHQAYLETSKEDTLDEFQLGIMEGMLIDLEDLEENESCHEKWDDLNAKSKNNMNKAVFSSFPIFDRFHIAYLNSLKLDTLDKYSTNKSIEMINLFDSISGEECMGNA